eukprot:m51a1_g14321 hypothetical protein (517) ;mRNA; r:32123-34786
MRGVGSGTVALQGLVNEMLGRQAQQRQRAAEGLLPASFVLPETARTPAKNQQSRGTCWIFATMGMLESSYRRNGHAKGLLRPDEYVALSEQAYGVGFVRYCQAHPEERFCWAGPAAGTPSDGRPEWLYYLGEHVAPYVLPAATNPLAMRVRGVEAAYTVDSIKRLLYSKQVALTWSHAIFQATYTIPCDDPHTALNASAQCRACAHPCSASGDGCCAEMVLKGYSAQGVFGLHRWPHRSGGHAMLVVGWNDEFRVDTGLPGQMHEKTVGGFIIKNSWGFDMGHTANYWASKHSLADEAFVCPAELSSATWLPLNATCMRETRSALGCSSQLVKIVRSRWVHGATVLGCNAAPGSDKAALYGWTSCNPAMRYALAEDEDHPGEARVTVPAASDGYMRFHLVEWDPAHPEAPANVVVTGDTTWAGLEVLLKPVNVTGNSEQCGFYFMPYETLEEGTVRYPTAGHDTAAVLYVDVEWDDSSYLRARKGDRNYELLAKSTLRMKDTKFQGPFDWNAAADV